MPSRISEGRVYATQVFPLSAQERLSFSTIHFFQEDRKSAKVQHIPPVRPTGIASEHSSPEEQLRLSSFEHDLKHARTSTRGTPTTLNLMNLDGAVASVFGRRDKVSAFENSNDAFLPASNHCTPPFLSKSLHADFSMEQIRNDVPTEETAVDAPTDAPNGSGGEGQIRAIGPEMIHTYPDAIFKVDHFAPKAKLEARSEEVARPSSAVELALESPVLVGTSTRESVTERPESKSSSRSQANTKATPHEQSDTMYSNISATTPAVSWSQVHNKTGSDARSRKRERRKHELRGKAGVRQGSVKTTAGRPVEPNTTSLAEYRKQILSRHRRSDHWPGHHSKFATVRREGQLTTGPVDCGHVCGSAV